jgi:hypothetical protein
MLARRSAALLLVSVAVGGCVPFPNYRYYAPAISGVVTQDGAPVGMAEVRVSGQFTEEVRSATTDRDGRFATEPVRKLLFTATLIGDPLYAYSVQITVGGKQYTGYAEASVGYAPSKFQLKCDLSRPIKLGSRQLYCSPAVESQ